MNRKKKERKYLKVDGHRIRIPQGLVQTDQEFLSFATPLRVYQSKDIEEQVEVDPTFIETLQQYNNQAAPRDVIEALIAVPIRMKGQKKETIQILQVSFQDLADCRWKRLELLYIPIREQVEQGALAEAENAAVVEAFAEQLGYQQGLTQKEYENKFLSSTAPEQQLMDVERWMQLYIDYNSPYQDLNLN